MRLSEARGADVLSTFPVKPSGKENDVRRAGKRTGHLTLAASADRRRSTAAESAGAPDAAGDAFKKEFDTSQDALESWYEHIETEYGPYLHGAAEDAEKRREGEMALEQYGTLQDRTEAIGNEWNTLDDRAAETGERRARLLAELRALAGQMPENVLAVKKEALDRFDAAHAALGGDARMSDGAKRKAPAREKSRAAGERKRRSERHPADRTFAYFLRALGKKRIFRQNGQPLLIIRAVTSEGIMIEYKNATADTEWRKDTVKPGGVQKFSEYLRSNFGWTPENKKAAESKPEKKPAPMETARGARPIDEDDAARELVPGGQLDDVGVKHLARQTAAEGISGEAAVSEQPTPQERPYEALEETLSTVKKKQCASVVSEGLSPFVQYAEKNAEVTLQTLVEQAGIENIISSIASSLIKILPAESGWNEQERLMFAAEFARREIVESLK